MVAVVNDKVSTDELKRMHALGVRGIRFNLAQAGATTPEMLEPLSKRVNDLGWHIQITAPAAKIMEIMPILEDKVVSPIVFDHLAHIPEPDGVNHPLFAKLRGLIDEGRTWMKLSGAYADTKVGPPTYADSSAVARAYAKAYSERCVWGSDCRTRPSSPSSFPTTRCCSTCSATGCPTRTRGTACSSKIRRRSTTSRGSRTGHTARRRCRAAPVGARRR
jgi:hypothetical protein